MTLEVQLTHGKIALVDDEDLPRVRNYSWRAARSFNNTWYAITSVRGADRQWKTVRMHRLILDADEGDPEVDHRNLNGLDNRRENLRTATHSQNLANGIGHPSLRKSKYKGVSWHRDPARRAGGRWLAKVTVGGKSFRHYAETELTAAAWYNALANAHFGLFSRPNRVP